MTTGGPTPTARQRLAAVRGQQVRGEDFGDADLTSVAVPGQRWFERCRFAGADLRHATLDRVSFKLCDFSGADLRGASLRGASFAACDLTGADLRGADLSTARFGAVGVGRGAIPTRLGRARLDEHARQALDLTEGGVLLD